MVAVRTRETGFERRADDIVKKERSVNEESKPGNLKPLESLPTQSEGHEPDKEGPAGVDGAAGGSGYGAGDGEAEKVESTETVVISMLWGNLEEA